MKKGITILKFFVIFSNVFSYFLHKGCFYCYLKNYDAFCVLLVVVVVVALVLIFYTTSSK